MKRKFKQLRSSIFHQYQQNEQSPLILTELTMYQEFDQIFFNLKCVSYIGLCKIRFALWDKSYTQLNQSN
jgi:hypothetical protein